MKQKMIEKMAAQDAHEWGVAEMFFGEGAGVRRRLISAKIDQKMHDIPGYAEAFSNATSKLNQIEMAEKALAERKRIDTAAKAGKNLRALKTGRISDLTNDVLIVGGVLYVAHVFEIDKLVWKESKKLYRKARTEVRYQRARLQGKNVSKIV